MKYRVNIQTVTKQWRDATVIIEANSAGEAEEKAFTQVDYYVDWDSEPAETDAEAYIEGVELVS